MIYLAYEYVSKGELKEYKYLVNNFFRDENGKELLIEHKCYYRLVGSSKRNLVLRDGAKNDGFDLDYQIVFYEYKKMKSDEMIEIKREFKLALDKFLTNYGYKNGEDSTTAITYKKIDGDKINTGYDFVLLMPLKDNSFAVFKYNDQEKTTMHLAQVKDSKDFNKNYKKIKGEDSSKLRNDYKEAKNNNPQNKRSFSLLVECVNNIINGK